MTKVLYQHIIHTYPLLSKGGAYTMATTTKTQVLSYDETLDLLGIKVILPEENNKSFDTIIGLKEPKKYLSQTLEFIKHPDEPKFQNATVYRKFLCAGENGSGRTLIATAFAKEADLPIIIIIHCEKFVAEKPMTLVNNLIQIFEKHRPCVVLFKKFEYIMNLGNTKAITVYSKINDYMNSLEDCYFFASADNHSRISELVFGREGLNFALPFEAPTLEQRIELFNKYINRFPHKDNIDISKIAKSTIGMYPNDISNIVSSSYNEALRTGKDKLDFECIDSVLSNSLYGYKKNVMTEKERKLTAYHEAGHVIAGYFSNPEYKLSKVEIAHRSESLGLTISEDDEDKLSYTKEDFENEIILCYGGLAAERLIFGTNTSGVSQDVEVATVMASFMVMSYAMSEDLGPIYLGNTPDSPFYSDALKEQADLIIQSMLNKLYERTEKLMLVHKSELIALSEALIEKETLYSEQVAEILKKFENK